MNHREFIQLYIEERVDLLLGNKRKFHYVSEEEIHNADDIRGLFQGRNAEIVKCQGTGRLVSELGVAGKKQIHYIVYLQYLVKQKALFYIQEIIEKRRMLVQKNKIREDILLSPEPMKQMEIVDVREEEEERESFYYDRSEAVKYAETWWNSYNPAFERFTENNCTNYISQCLYAGNAPMRGYPKRERGWWYQNKQWSYSWTSPHALWVYLVGSKTGLRAERVERPEDLKMGDLIFYDFEGDGRWNHSTIVVAKDYYGMPLVNAQSTNSRYRYWDYKDSYKYTKNIKYTFFHIVDDYS